MKSIILMTTVFIAGCLLGVLLSKKMEIHLVLICIAIATALVWITASLLSLKWFRVKAIILLAISAPSIPAIELTASQFDLDFKMTTNSWGAMIVGVVFGIVALFFLEKQATRDNRVSSTINGFIKFINADLESNGDRDVSLEIIDELESDPCVDQTVFKMITAWQLWVPPSRGGINKRKTKG